MTTAMAMATPATTASASRIQINEIRTAAVSVEMRDAGRRGNRVTFATPVRRWTTTLAGYPVQVARASARKEEHSLPPTAQ
jgi:hypothetical protein